MISPPEKNTPSSTGIKNSRLAMPAPNRTELRTFIVERFKRDELGILCNDYDGHRQILE